MQQDGYTFSNSTSVVSHFTTNWRRNKTTIFKVPVTKNLRLLRGAVILLISRFPKPNSSNPRKGNDLPMF